MRGVQSPKNILLSPAHTSLNTTNEGELMGTNFIRPWKLVLLALTVNFGANAQLYRNVDLNADQKNKTIGVRLLDFAKFTNAISELSSEEAEELQEKWDRFVEKEYQLDKTLNLFLHDYPKKGPGGYILPVTVFGQLKEGKDYVFIQTNAYFDGKDFSVQIEKVINLNETLFDLNVSLIERKLVVKDNLSSLSMIFPLGVGSFDQKVLNEEVTLLTPRFENAFLDQWTAISERKKPRYFAGKPFLRITTDKNPANGHTAIGFHAQPNLDTFIRAFDSHGCMRMQLDDLMMMHDLLKEGPHRHLSISVKFNTEDTLDHPFPKRNKPFKKVLNAGSSDNPRWVLDRDDLVQTTTDWDNSAPTSLLVDREGDSHHDLFNYDMDWRKAERARQKRQICLEDFPYTTAESKRDQRKLEKEFEECMKEGKRSRGLRDRVYRWWVH